MTYLPPAIAPLTNESKIYTEQYTEQDWNLTPSRLKLGPMKQINDNAPFWSQKGYPFCWRFNLSKA